MASLVSVLGMKNEDVGMVINLCGVIGGFLFADGYPFEPPKMQFATKVW